MWVTTDFGETYNQVYIGEQYAIEAVYPHPRRDDLFLGVLSSSCCYQPCSDYCSADVRVTHKCLNYSYHRSIIQYWYSSPLFAVGPIRGLRSHIRRHREEVRQHASWHHSQLGQGWLWRLQRQIALRCLRARDKSGSGTQPKLFSLYLIPCLNNKRRILIPICTMN